MKHLRYLTDAAMTTALMMALLLISHYTGAELEETCPFLVPIPVALYTMKYGWQKGIIPAIAISLLSLLHNPLHGLFFVTSGNIIGHLYGWSLHRNYTSGKRILIAISGSLIVNLLTLVFFSQLLYGYTIVDDMKSTVQWIINQLPESWGTIHASLEAIVIGLIPTIILLISILEGLLFHTISTLLSARLFHQQEHRLYHQVVFRIPRVMTAIGLVVYVLSLVFLPQYPSLEGFLRYLLIFGINLTFLMFAFYIGESMFFFAALTRFYQKRWIYLLACFGLLLFPLHIIIGMIDSLFPLMKHIEKKALPH